MPADALVTQGASASAGIGIGQISQNIPPLASKELKPKCCHDTNLVNNGALEVVIMTNLQCHQWWQIGHQDISWFQCAASMCCNNSLWPRENGRHFADDIFKCIFLNENVWIPIKISLKFVPKGPINNIPALVRIMAWRRPGDKPLSEPMMVSLLTHICVTQPQWVKPIIWVELFQ